MSFLTGVFIILLAGMGLAAIAEIAKAFSRRGTSSRAIADLKKELEQHATALREAQGTLSDQAAQLAELQERLDFAERLLTQARDRGALEPGRGQQ